MIDAADIDRTGPYAPVSEQICALFGVKTGAACVDRSEEPLFRICLINITARDECAFVAVVSHVLGDRRTFYRLQAMFDRDAAVGALIVERDVQFAAKKAALIGKEQYSIFTSTAFTAAPLISEHLTACAPPFSSCRPTTL